MRPFALFAAFAVLGLACSSSSGGGGASSSSGGGSGNGGSSGSSCTCDISYNGVAKTLTCGQSACVNGESFSCGSSGSQDQGACTQNNGSSGSSGTSSSSGGSSGSSGTSSSSSGGSSGSSSGSSGSSSGSSGSTPSDATCAQKGTAVDCTFCCNDAHSDGWSTWTGVWNNCACVSPGQCGTVCATSLCQNGVAGQGADCVSCMDLVRPDCNTAASTSSSCKAQADCTAYVSCIAQCSGKP